MTLDPAITKKLEMQKLRKEMEKQKKCETLVKAQTELVEKAVPKAFMRRLHLERREAETEKLITAAKESQGWRKLELEQEEDLAYELDKDKRAKINEVKMRQKLYDCPELRELEEQLRSAYIYKELKAQIAENKARKMQEELEDKRFSQNRQKMEMFYNEIEENKKIEEQKRKQLYRECLQDQMIDNYKAKQDKYKEFLQEKALIDEAVKAILEEDRKEEEYKLLRIQKSREDLDAFKRAKQIWMAREKEAQEAEDKRIREYLESKFQKEKERQANYKALMEERARQKEAAVQKLVAERASKEEQEKLLTALAHENKVRQEEMQEKKKLEAAIRAKCEIREIFANQIKQRLAHFQEEKERDIEYSKELMERFIEENKLDQLSNVRRKMKEMEYRRKLKEEIEERHKARLLETKKETFYHELEEEARKERRRLIEEERVRLLQEHASKLVGYLPKGVLRESDLPKLGPNIQEFYGKKTENDK